MKKCSTDSQAKLATQRKHTILLRIYTLHECEKVFYKNTSTTKSHVWDFWYLLRRNARLSEFRVIFTYIYIKHTYIYIYYIWQLYSLYAITVIYANIRPKTTQRSAWTKQQSAVVDRRIPPDFDTSRAKLKAQSKRCADKFQYIHTGVCTYICAKFHYYEGFYLNCHSTPGCTCSTHNKHTYTHIHVHIRHSNFI